MRREKVKSSDALRKVYKARRKAFDKRQNELRSDLLMSGVAHEFNNILGAADGHAEWALDSKKTEDMIEALKVVRIACQRSATITKALRGVSQPREESEEELKLSDLISEFQKVLLPFVQKTGALLKIQVPPKVRLRGIRNEILEIFLNLVKNSLEAALEYGKSPEIVIEGHLRNKKIVLSFRDNGPGVPKALEDLIFQPFFTTKGVLGNLSPELKPKSEQTNRTQALSSGTGLGLFWSRKICQEMGGSLELKRQSGSGQTYFEVSLKTL